MTAEASTNTSTRGVGRYEFHSLLSQSGHSSLWRAYDPVLDATVCVRLLPLDDPRAGAVYRAAREAAHVSHVRLVRIHDIFEADGQLAIVTEWVDGRTWGELIRERVDYTDAAIVSFEVARSLRAAHALGVSHGRLRPSAVIITDSGVVRLLGLGVDAALFGTAPDDAVSADLNGIGALLYAGLTGRWPLSGPGADVIDGLVVVDPIDGRLPEPMDLDPRVPRNLNDIASACLHDDYTDLGEAAAALAQSVELAADSTPEGAAAGRQHEVIGRHLPRVVSVIVIGIVVAVWLGLLQWVFTGSASPAAEEPGADPAPAAADVAPTPQASAPAVKAPVPVPIAASDDFDPEGIGKSENPNLVPLATDGDPATAWLTTRYKVASMKPKRGVGVVLDLGETRQVSSVSLDLLGSGTDLEIRAADQPGRSLDDYALLASVPGAGEHVNADLGPIQTRYVLVWFTKVPYQNSTYQGGIREVRVLS